MTRTLFFHPPKSLRLTSRRKNKSEAHVWDKSYCLWGTSKDVLSPLAYEHFYVPLPSWCGSKKSCLDPRKNSNFYWDFFQLCSSIMLERTKWKPLRIKGNFSEHCWKAETKKILCKYLNPIVLCQLNEWKVIFTWDSLICNAICGEKTTQSRLA